MDIKSIRRANLALLVDEVGSVTALAKMANSAQAYLSQIIGPRPVRSVGDDLARRLEHVCRKSTGWMDQSHVEDEKAAKCRAIFEVLLHLPHEKIDALITLFDLSAAPGSLGRINLEAIPRRKTGPRLIDLGADVAEQEKRPAAGKGGRKSGR